METFFQSFKNSLNKIYEFLLYLFLGVLKYFND